MSRRPKALPSYRLHKQSGQAIVTLTDGTGRRRDVLLGQHDTGESRAEYLRVVGEWEATGRRLPAAGDGADAGLSVNELLVAFLRHAEQHYRTPDGNATTELRDYKLTLRPLRELYGLLPAADFSPLKLKALRFRMVETGLTRGVVNQRVGRVVRVFKWGVSEELVPESTWRALTTVRGLERGRTKAKDPEPVGPVSDAVVEATLPFLTAPVLAMVRLQRLTGMRPGEVCRMRACDLDMTGAVWLYRPPHHKTAHRGKARVVALGPKAQDVVRPFLHLDLQAYLFSPRAAVEGLRSERRAARKTLVQPSQRCRQKPRPERAPGERYTGASYQRAIARGCRRANDCRLAAGPCRPGDMIPVWSPNRLRHTHATEVRRRYGLEAAQVALGHSQADVTQVYAERDQALAVRVAAEIG